MKGNFKILAGTFCAFIAGAMLFSGCATITKGTKQKVSITTSTGKSVVATIGSKKVNIPAQVNISRKKGATIRVLAEDNPGYEDTQLVITGKNKVTGVFWLNILWGGTFGSTTDAITGGMWAYTNPNFTVPVSEVRK